MRQFLLLCICLPLVVWLISLSLPSTEDAGEDIQVDVVVSIHPLKLMCEALLGEAASIHCLLPAGMSPHTYAARPSDLRAVKQSRLFVSIGPSLDQWSQKIPAARHFQALKALPEALSLRMEEHCTHDDHDGHEHDHSHHHHGAVSLDPHFWMDPQACSAVLTGIAQELIAVFPQDAQQITERLTQVQALLKEQEKELMALAQPIKGAALVQFHPSMNYLFRRFHLQSAGVVDPIAGVDPHARHVQELINTNREKNIYAVIAEPQLPQRSAQHIADTIEAKICVLDPMAGQATTLMDIWQAPIQALLDLQQ